MLQTRNKNLILVKILILLFLIVFINLIFTPIASAGFVKEILELIGKIKKPPLPENLHLQGVYEVKIKGDLDEKGLRPLEKLVNLFFKDASYSFLKKGEKFLSKTMYPLLETGDVFLGLNGKYHSCIKEFKMPWKCEEIPNAKEAFNKALAIKTEVAKKFLFLELVKIKGKVERQCEVGTGKRDCVCYELETGRWINSIMEKALATQGKSVEFKFEGRDCLDKEYEFLLLKRDIEAKIAFLEKGERKKIEVIVSQKTTYLSFEPPPEDAFRLPTEIIVKPEIPTCPQGQIDMKNHLCKKIQLEKPDKIRAEISLQSYNDKYPRWILLGINEAPEWEIIKKELCFEKSREEYECKNECISHGKGWLCVLGRGFETFAISIPFDLEEGEYTICVAVTTPDYDGDRCWIGKLELIKSPTCKDGTRVGECSKTKPLYCNEKLELVNNCSSCGCEENYFCNKKAQLCLAKGWGCYKDEDCWNLYDSKEFKCIGSYGNIMAGHCCLKDEIWNGAVCEKEKIVFTLIPLNMEWKDMKEDPIELLKEALEFFPWKDCLERIEIKKWSRCNIWPPVKGSQLLCPHLTSAPPSHRYIIFTNDVGFCGTGENVGGCASPGSNLALIIEKTAKTIIHELGHTYGLLDEYCYYYHPFPPGWMCGPYVEPNPLKPEYGCDAEKDCKCKGSPLLSAQKTRVKVNEPVSLTIANIENCQNAKIDIISSTEAFFLSCVADKDGKGMKNNLCAIGFGSPGRYKFKARVFNDSVLKKYVDSNEIEIEVTSEIFEPKSSCSSPIPLTPKDLKANQFYKISLDIEGKIECLSPSCKFKLLNASCREIKEIELKTYDIYNIKPDSYIIQALNDFMINLDYEYLLPWERCSLLNACCWERDIYAYTCLGNKVDPKDKRIDAPRSVMSVGPYQSKFFDPPSWYHLKKMIKCE